MGTKCFFCFRDLNTRIEINSKHNLGKNLLKTELRTIFLLRKLLQVSSTSCINFVADHGNPSSWISYCSQCNGKIQEAENIWSRISKLQAKLKSIQNDLELMITTRQKSLSESADLYNYGLEDVIRKKIFQRLHKEDSIEDPVNICDIKLEDPNAVNSDEGCDFPYDPNSPENHESPLTPLSDMKDEQGFPISDVQEIDNSLDDSLICRCGKKYVFLKCFERHKRLCDGINRQKPLPLKEAQLDNSLEKCVSGKDIGSFNETCSPERDSQPPKYRKSPQGKYIRKTKKWKGWDRKPHFCQECGKKCKRVRDLRRHTLNFHFHILGDTTQRDFPCPSCEMSFTTEVLKNAHFRAVHKRMHPYMCSLCDKRCLVLESFQAHMAVHVKEGEAQCNKCELKFCDQETLATHKRIVHERHPKPFVCPICENRFKSASRLKMHHTANHKAPRDIICEFCTSTFVKQSELESHKRKLHYKELNMEPILCEKCPKRRFGSETELRHHETTNHRVSCNFYCSKCKTRGFMKESSLQYHMESKHPTGTEKNFPCSICGKLFKTHSRRHLHIKHLHNATYSIQCPTCPKKFKTRKCLSKHILRVHSEPEKVQCPYCPLMFKMSKYLDAHIRNKHEEDGASTVIKNIPCQHCPMMFSDNSYLINHMKKKHNDPNDM